MSPTTASVVGRHFGGGILLVSFVGLVTFMFSFLGTILCAALFGMMVGFGRRWKWQTLAVSLVFPMALLASLHASSSQAGLPWPDSLRLASVCFGTFWVTYLATIGIFLLEGAQREPASAASQTGARAQPEQASAESWHDLAIEELQGKWSQETPLTTGRKSRKVISVSDHELTMTLVSEDGQARLLAKGQMQLVKPAHA